MSLFAATGRGRLAGRALTVALGGLLLAGCAGSARDHGATAGHTTGASAPTQCNSTRVHYRPYSGVEDSFRGLPWIQAVPASLGLVGHLFYYDIVKVWEKNRLPDLRIYTGGRTPDGRGSMKILWELRRGGGGGAGLGIRGERLDGPGSFTQDVQGALQLASTSTIALARRPQFPSIVNVPAPGCWQLVLTVGEKTGHVTVLAVGAEG
jgi:hypothetical protein